MKKVRMTAALLALPLLCACGNDGVTLPPVTNPPANNTVVPINASGPVRVSFAGANVAPGSILNGCGPMIAGCQGRLRMAFDLVPQQSGPVLGVSVYMHAPQIACLWGRSPSFNVTAGATVHVEIPLDNADACATPLMATSMDVVVDGPVQIASRQEFTVNYLFVP
jgi:hypothetical protein